MVQGTMSNSGKSFLTAGLCRVFKQDGYKVAPFKSQNMALNSYITKEGLEIGRAQAMQAEACGIDPTADMNPILLKPTSNVGSQVIVNGEVRGNMKAMDYYKNKKQLIPDVLTAYERLSNEYDIIVIEGAGSPAEINLHENDIVNIRIRATGNLVYGSDYKLEVETRPENTQYIAVVLGTSGEAYGYVTLMISEKLRTLLKLIPLPKKMSQTPDQAEEFNVYSYLKQLIDGNDVGVLLRVADEVVSVMDTVSFFVPASYLTTVKNVSNGMKLTLSLIRKYLPEGALSRIYLDEQPKDSGKYVAGAIALESSDINAAGFAMFKIKPKTENVSLSWAADAPSSMTVSQLQNADLTAKVISDGQVAENGKVNYTYKKKTFLCFSSKINGVPTEPGTYTQTAKAGGNYSCGSISRTITVTADPQPAAEQSAEQAAEQPAA